MKTTTTRVQTIKMHNLNMSRKCTSVNDEIHRTYIALGINQMHMDHCACVCTVGHNRTPTSYYNILACLMCYIKPIHMHVNNYTNSCNSQFDT